MGKQGSPFAAELPELARRDAQIVRRYKAGENLESIGAALDLTRELTAIATRCAEVETVLRALVPFDAQMWTQTEMTVVGLFEQ